MLAARAGRRPTLLLSNDDGVAAPGLAIMADVCSRFADVTVVAPATSCSGGGHWVTVDRPLHLESVRPNWYALDGSPADAIRVALSSLGLQPDWVLSGINNGANLGVDLAMSGTVAAAREATFAGIAAIAVSRYRRGNALDWTGTAELLDIVLRQILALELPPRCFVNINLPDPLPSAGDGHVVWCAPDPNPLPTGYEQVSGGLLYSGVYHERPVTPGCDATTCFSGDVAASYVAALGGFG